MADHNEQLLRRPLYVYDLPGAVLENLTHKADSDVVVTADEDASLSSGDKDRDRDRDRDPGAAADSLVGYLACSLCSLTFAALQDQRSHLKSDLHHYNLKQKLRGLKPVSEPEFEKLIGDLDESLSGSDSDDSEDYEDDGPESTLTTLLKRQARLADKRGDAGGSHEHLEGRHTRTNKPPLIWFGSPVLPKKTYFGLYRAILTGEELRNSDLVQVLRTKQVAPISMPKPAKDGAPPPVAYKGPHIFLCMIGGGHFAAMVVSLAPRATKAGGTAMNREATVLAHKTFHRYTTRRKQGGSQSANDNSKGNAHSAGSSLRRYNEQALVQDVRALLDDWKALLDTSELLFIRATGATNRRTLFGPYDGQVLQHNDARLRGFPFSTRRATQKELMRSFIELTRLKIREIDPAKEANKTKEGEPEPRQTHTSSPKPAKPKLSEEEESALLHTSQLQALIRRSKLPALLSYLSNNQLSPDFEFQPREQNHHAPRPLHLAAAQNSAPLVLGMLTRAGANPLIRNGEDKTAFELAGDRSTRDAFRVARSELGESRWAWEQARVPAAMSRAEADGREERERQEAQRKEAERRKAEEERLRREGPQVVEGKKPRGKNALAAGLAKTPEERREEETRGLTPEKKLWLERERRARAAEERLRRMAGGA